MTRPPYTQEMRALQDRRPAKTKHIILELGITYDPGTPLASMPEEQTLGHAGINLQGAPTMNILLSLIKSRKFWAAVAGLVLIVVQAFIPDFPLDAEAVTNVIYVVVAFIIGTGLEDVSGEPKG
jgi:hypothetical protein